MLQQPHHVILLLPLFRHMSIPPFFKHYLALRLGRLSDHLLPHFDNPEHNLPSHLTASHPELAQHVTHHDLWKMLFDNNMADEVIRITSLYSSPSSVCGPQYLINMIAVHVEPLLQNDEQLLTMLRRIRTELRDRQMLLSNQVAENWSSRATRLVAQSFLIPAGLHRELQYRVCIPWSWLDSEHHVDPILTKFDSIAFEVRVRYEERASNIVMTCRQLDETATEDRKRVSVSLVVMDTGCRCKCEERLDREWSGLIAEENHPTNSQDVADVMGEVSIIDAQDLQQWWERHEEGCEIDVNIKLEVD